MIEQEGLALGDAPQAKPFRAPALRQGKSVALTADDAPATMLALIARAASDPRVDVAKMEALLNMQRQLERDQARAEFNAAFAELAPRLPRITKKGAVRYPVNKNAPEGPSRLAFYYATWEDIDAEIRPLLNEHGFSLSYNTESVGDGRVVVTTTLLHKAGHEKTVQFGPLPLDTSGGKNNIQALGSTFSYGKRYGATAVLNLVFEGEDDDGVRGGEEFIDAQSVNTLSDLLIETKSDLGKFCATVGVSGLPEIKVGDFPAALNLLMDKRKRLQGSGAA